MNTSALASSGRVLVVDDEPGILSACMRGLREHGYTPVGVDDGTEALEAVRSSSFDVVVSDIQMRSMDGMALLRAIRERDLDVPVVLMTGMPSVESAVDAMSLGAFRYLLKPFSIAELVRVVEDATRLHKMARAKRAAIELLGDGGRLLGDPVSLAIAFERALETLWVAFQPIIDPVRRTVFGYEALVRTREPALPHPGALFDAAERLDRVAPLGRHIRSLIPGPVATLAPEPLIFVNLHATDLLDPSLYDPTSPLASVAKRTVLEITERSTLDHVKDVKARIADLRAMGYRIAVDDLGAGYAGLTSFVALEPDIVKLDLSLIRGIDQAPVKRKIVAAMTGIAHELGMLIVAEGIETASERDVLIELGCDLHQGFLFARPGPPFPDVQW